MYQIAIYISNHGYGHASRMAALAEALIDFGQRIYICTDRPAFLFQNLPAQSFEYRKVNLDGGVKHQKNLKVDYAATKELIISLFAQREKLVVEEAIWLRESKIDLVIADIPFFVVEAAGFAEIPVFGISNFDWSYIYSRLFEGDSELKLLINSIFGLYKRMDKCYLPGFGDEESVMGFSSPQNMGVLAKKCRNSAPARAQKRLLIMFGGEGGMELDFEAVCAAWEGEVLSTSGVCTASNHRLISKDADFACLIAEADLLICKPGYSTLAEAVNSGVPVIYIPRENYPEEKQLILGLSDYHAAYKLDKTPESITAWKELFEKLPKGGKRLENQNYEIAGQIMQDFLQLKMPRAKLISVFDLGSNNLNYTLFDLDSGSVLNRTYITTALGMHYLDGKLQIERLDEITALSELLKADSKILSEKHLIATGVMRKAANAHLLLDDMCERWQIKGKIITSYQEMRYVWQAASGMVPHGKNALLFDIGGFSTELAWRTNTGAVAGFSLDIGLISLFQASDPFALIQGSLDAIPSKHFDLIIAVGLTARLLAEMLLQSRKDENAVQLPISLNIGDLSSIESYVQEIIQPDRQTLSLGIAASFTKQILDKFGRQEILVSTDGISVGFAKWKRKKKLIGKAST